jgi:exo-beta-1,3-glucanase (GH17 family)
MGVSFVPDFNRSTLTLVSALTVFFVCALANFGLWWWFNRPVVLPLSFDAPLTSVSFAPYRCGQSPIAQVYPSPTQIEEDMASLVGVAHGIRTYTSREGLEQVPLLARKYGLSMTQGAWLTVPYNPDGTPTVNDAELTALIRSANSYPDVVQRVIVGNEVLLRGELTPNQLINYIRRVKAAVKQPVTYADVWAFFEKYPEVGREVDFLTIHILPYWEDEPVSLKQAAEHVVLVYRRMQKLFPDKPILIGEVGWPTQGRSRGPAVPSVENSAYFLRTVARLSKENGFDYNWVEAFDQCWKSAQEETIGANWGILDAQRRVKFRLDGPVVPNPGWLWQAMAAVLLGVVGFLLVSEGQRSSWRQYSPRNLWWVVAMAQFLASLVIIQAIYVWSISYTTGEELWAGLRIAVSVLFAGAILTVAAGELRRSAARVKPAIHLALILMIFYALAAVFNTVLLLIDGRYRDIPNLEFLLPSLGIAAYVLARISTQGEGWIRASAPSDLLPINFRYENILFKSIATGLISAMIVGPLSESWALSRGIDFFHIHPNWAERLPLLMYALVANQEMLMWSALLGVMAVPFVAQWYLTSKAPSEALWL